ncbi:MAG: hypothetical protein AB1925_18485 [Actinomycetota bacterium]
MRGAVVTGVKAVNRCPVTRAEQLEQLRRQMASVSGKVGVSRRPAPAAAPEVGDPGAADSLLEMADLGASIPVPRGTVAVVSGARSLELKIVAAVTAEGGHVAIIGQPDVGLLAAVEMGADLSRIAVIPEPGADPVEVAAVLMDGMDLVVLGLGGRSVPPSRARAVVARARQRGCTLLVTDGAWQGASTRLEATVSGYDIAGPGGEAPIPGCGRIGRVRLAMRARGRSVGPGVLNRVVNG